MKDRGKAVEAYNRDDDRDLFAADYDASSHVPCRKHPNSSSVGVCAQCLKDRLVKLVCSECGEQRLSSCSCSDISSHRNSCAAVEVGSVGRISFLLENEKAKLISSSTKPRGYGGSNNGGVDEVMLLKRSSSSCVEIKRSNGLWRIGRLFRKKKDKKTGFNNGNANSCVNGFDSKSEMWVVDHQHVGVSRSRSLSSFRGGNYRSCYFGSDDGADNNWTAFSGGRSSVSGARTSSVNGGVLLLDPERRSGFSEAEPRKSCFSEAEYRRSGFSETDAVRRSCFSEAEPRKSGFSGFSSETEPRKSGIFLDCEKKENVSSFDHVVVAANSVNFKKMVSLRESDFSGVDDPGFIDLKFFSSDTTTMAAATTTNNMQDLAGAAAKMGVLGSCYTKSAYGSMRETDYGGGGVIGEGEFRSGSCRVATVSDQAMMAKMKMMKMKTKGRRSNFMGWRWVFGQHTNWMSAKKKDEGVLCGE